MMMGPNTLSGHLSVIYTTECQINLALRVIKPVMAAIRAARSSVPSLRKTYDIVDVNSSAEQRDIDAVQDKAKKLVWATGCTSWFIEEKSSRNTIMFPDFQYKFWLRSIFISWSDFNLSASAALVKTNAGSARGKGILLATVLSAMVGAGAFVLSSRSYTCFKGARLEPVNNT